MARPLAAAGTPVMKAETSREKRVLRCIQVAQWGNPRSPPRGNRLSSPDHAISFSALRTGSSHISSARGGLSNTHPCRSAVQAMLQTCPDHSGNCHVTLHSWQTAAATTCQIVCSKEQHLLKTCVTSFVLRTACKAYCNDRGRRTGLGRTMLERGDWSSTPCAMVSALTKQKPSTL